MTKTEHSTPYGVCEACGTPTPEDDLSTVQTPAKPLTACPSCRPDQPLGGREVSND